MPRLIVMAVVLMGLSGCGVEPPDATGRKPELVVSLKLEQVPPGARDSISIEGASISRDELVLDISHGGGCGEHMYGLSWDGSFAESNPVQARLILLHDSHGDMCLALLHKKLHVDLTPMKERWREQYRREHGVIELRFADSTATARYEF
ncbi:hypothetical protein [Cystobacter fuscus]|uniref:hypothetical protein n=1 Tax=Cystobacter fuscus TaxID=43 RepID=UPI002B2E4C9D|nr:hypothetical protein F0U63_42355 [Cystobacter fuscus]